MPPALRGFPISVAGCATCLGLPRQKLSLAKLQHVDSRLVLHHTWGLVARFTGCKIPRLTGSRRRPIKPAPARCTLNRLKPSHDTSSRDQKPTTFYCYSHPSTQLPDSMMLLHFFFFFRVLGQESCCISSRMTCDNRHTSGRESGELNVCRALKQQKLGG